MSESIPEHIRRFLLTSIDSVPHLEATLLVLNSSAEWTPAGIAQRLFIPEKRAVEILSDLCTAGFVAKTGDTFRFDPVSPKLRELLEELNQIYPRHLVQISSLLHTKTDKQAQTFGDAFKFRKE